MGEERAGFGSERTAIFERFVERTWTRDEWRPDGRDDLFADDPNDKLCRRSANNAQGYSQHRFLLYLIPTFFEQQLFDAVGVEHFVV